MKYFIFIFAVAIIASCHGSRFCNLNKNYLKTGIDKTKPFKLKGAYCIESIRDTAIGGLAQIRLNIFDRVNGKRMYNGVAWFYGTDTSSIILNEHTFEKNIKPGKYTIEAVDVGYIGAKTRVLEVKANTKIDINFYLGTVVEY